MMTKEGPNSFIGVSRLFYNLASDISECFPWRRPITKYTSTCYKKHMQAVNNVTG